MSDTATLPNVADTVAAPPAAPAPAAQVPAAPPAAPAIPWMANVTDAELIGHAQNAGWKDAADAVKSHRELQKLFGADRHGRTVVVPKEDDAPEVHAAFYARLGRPETPDGYKIPVPDGADPSFSKGVAAKFHEFGIPAKAAEGLASWWNQQAASAQAAAAQAESDALAAEHAALQKDWGSEHPMRQELARRAAQRLGLDEPAINALEKATGFSGVMKALAKVGDLLREGGGEGLGELGTFGRTPEGAKAERAQLMADKEWRAKAMNPNSREWAKLQELDKIISGS